jgi:hypothetical protein
MLPDVNQQQNCMQPVAVASLTTKMQFKPFTLVILTGETGTAASLPETLFRQYYWSLCPALPCA